MDIDDLTGNDVGMDATGMNKMDVSQDYGDAEMDGSDVQQSSPHKHDSGISVNMVTITAVFELLLSSGSEGVVNSLFHALTSLVSQLQSRRLVDPRVPLLLLALPTALHFSDVKLTDEQQTLFAPLVKNILALPGGS